MRRVPILFTLTIFVLGCGEGTYSENDGENKNNTLVTARKSLSLIPPGFDEVVCPTDTLLTIQEKVDNGGTILFKAGDYNQFGTIGHIFLGQTGNDVHIVGEYDSTVTPSEPTIHGGQVVFRAGGTGHLFNFLGLLPFCDPLPAVNLSITGLHFIGSSNTAIAVFASKGLKISGCRFTEPRLYFTGEEPHPVGSGIMIGRPAPAFIVNAVREEIGIQPIDFTNPDMLYTGTTEITDNVFDGRGMSYEYTGPYPTPEDPPEPPPEIPEEAVLYEREYTGPLWYTGMSNAIIAFYMGYSDLTISGNEITGTLSTGLSSENEYITKILNNSIAASEYPAWYNSGLGFGPAESVIISKNTIKASGDGIWGGSNNAIVKKNNITMSPFYSGIHIGGLDLGGLTNSTIGNNKISGTTYYGCRVKSGSTGNFFNGNNLTGLTLRSEDPNYPLDYPPSFYVFESGACNNTVKGYTGGNNTLVVDEDGCNDMTGVE